MKLPSKLSEKLKIRHQEESLRMLSERSDRVDFSSNDYLGFSRNKAISAKASAQCQFMEHVNGSTGSRLLSGNFEFHESLESDLADFFESPAALLFNSGYDANLGLFSSVLQRGDRIFYDDLCHASIRDGIRLSNAKAYAFSHNDIESLKKKVMRTPSEQGESYLVVESVYSMDGDQAPLKDLLEFAETLNLRIIIDEAHATGVIGMQGKGLVVHIGAQNKVFARMHTFGKAMGCHGAVVLGSDELKEFLINFSRPFIYTTAMPLHNVATIKFALKELQDTGEIIKLQQNISAFKKAISHCNMVEYFIESDSPIQSFLIASPEKARSLAKKISERNFDVKPILSPTVPKGKERLRFCIHSYNTYEQINEILFLLSTFA